MIYRGIVTENSGAVLLARITKADGTYPAQGDINTITVNSYDADAETLIKNGTADKSSAIYNGIQNDARWTADGVGFNMELDLDGGYWPDGDATVRVEAKIVPTAGNSFYVVWELQVDKVLSE